MFHGKIDGFQFPVLFPQENQSIEPQRATPLTHQATEGVDGQTQHQWTCAGICNGNIVGLNVETMGNYVICNIPWYSYSVHISYIHI